LIDDPRFRTNADRVRNVADLDDIMGGFFASHTQKEAVDLLEKAEVTAGPIYDISQILEDPHFISREVLSDYPDDEMDSLPMHHVVPRMMGTPGSIRTPAPSLGQHNESLLSELGFDQAAYRRLVNAGVVSTPSNHEAEASE